MGVEEIILANPYIYNFLKGLTHSALVGGFYNMNQLGLDF